MKHVKDVNDVLSVHAGWAWKEAIATTDVTDALYVTEVLTINCFPRGKREVKLNA
jgi:hypothetical protein